MTRRHPLSLSRLSRSGPPLPGVWLFSDERLGLPVERLAARLPPGSGIVLRHDRLAPGARWRLARRLMRIARARKLRLLLTALPATACRWGVDGVHLRQPLAHRAAQARRLGLRLSMPVHDGAEARRARRARADVAFVSPLHATRSHPGVPGLGQKAWLRLARLAGTRAVALGGLTPPRARALRRAAMGSRITPGWAAIDAWDQQGADQQEGSRQGKRKERDAAARRRTRQKRKAVPT